MPTLIEKSKINTKNKSENKNAKQRNIETIKQNNVF